ncbi:putative sodium-dependent multivitamin transporter isoform X2 [Orussus abietinus]|uniref:putative sodium-dependent multivitamin transporter isoform X2 n=1 Tax=Orussus abietinus TaxID=222816 RepID=UPI000625807E|nr:putative sodium-dependent multivitamin transporter isoform X2 [Orussus abietinus]
MAATLGVADYAVCAATLLISSGIGVYYRLTGGRQKTTEYLQLRFGKVTRVIASAAFLVQLLLYTGVVLYAPSLALEATTGFSKTWSIIVIGLVCIFYSALGGIKAVLVTDIFQSVLMFLGILTVIVTATLQVGSIGRIWEIAEEGSRIQFDSISIDPTVRHTWWSLTIGGFFTYLSLYGVNQVQVQRMLTIKDLKSAQAALWWSWPIASVMSLVTCFSGLAIYSRYKDCDPVAAGRIQQNDQLMPLYVMDTLSRYPGFPGLFVAGIFSAGLSTISATLNSVAAVVLEDFIRPACRARGKTISPSGSILVSKVLVILVGGVCLAVAFLAQHLGGVLQAALTIFGVVGGPTLGLFTLGMFCKHVEEKGAVVGFLLSLMFSLWVGFGQPKPGIPTLDVSTSGCNDTALNGTWTSSIVSPVHDDGSSYFYLYRISYMWYCPLGFLMCLLIGLLASRILRWAHYSRDPEDLDPDLFVPAIASRMRKDQMQLDGDNKRET